MCYWTSPSVSLPSQHLGIQGPQNIQRQQWIFKVGHGVISGLRASYSGLAIVIQDDRVNVMTGRMDDGNYVCCKPLVEM